VLAVPTIIIISKNDKKSILPITIMAIFLGTCIGVVGYYLHLM